jgi:hypothetical protein
MLLLALLRVVNTQVRGGTVIGSKHDSADTNPRLVNSEQHLGYSDDYLSPRPPSELVQFQRGPYHDPLDKPDKLFHWHGTLQPSIRVFSYLYLSIWPT